jgi:hypothetical protein
MSQPSKVIAGQIRHQIPGRVRIVLARPLPTRDALERMAEELAALPEMEAIEVRPGSGGLIVHHVGDFDTLLDGLARAGLKVTPAAEPAEESEPVDPIRAVGEKLAAVDKAIAQASGGRVDLWGAAFVTILAAGVIQLGRGRIAGPALTLFGQAATLAMARPLRMFVR